MDLSPRDLQRILKDTRTIASFGVSSNNLKDSYWIVHYLQFQGYKIFPVNPTADEIFGEKAYPNLASLPEAPDVVQVFRKSEDVPTVVDAAIEKGAKVVWMQEGIANEEAAETARAAGLKVVMSTCMRNAHQVLIGDQAGWRQHMAQDENYLAFLQNLAGG